MRGPGIVLDEDPAGSRRLCIATSLEDVRILVLRAQDVPTFVEHGAADLGITGKDVLLEHRGAGLYEPLDLGIARCRLVLAAGADAKPARPRPRVATKYVETTRRFFSGKGIQAEIIRLYGSMEIAPRPVSPTASSISSRPARPWPRTGSWSVRRSPRSARG